ncbi:MAG: aluminum activated malate transporter family protein [Candidatus Obscuribacterales bacterium]|nr:aluminum activated malate transporter family protein [Candidatus Obscuribacterales bacterium]
MTFFITLAFALAAIAGWKLNRRYPSGIGLLIATVIFFGAIAIANPYAGTSQALVNTCFIFIFAAFGYIMSGAPRHRR